MKKALLATAILILTIFGYVERDYAAVLSWDKNTDATTYTVYVRDAGGANTDYRVVQDGIAGTSITVMPSIHNHDYEYAVKAFNECGNSSDYSDPVKYNDCLSQVIKKTTGLKISITLSVSGISAP